MAYRDHYLIPAIDDAVRRFHSQDPYWYDRFAAKCLDKADDTRSPNIQDVLAIHTTFTKAGSLYVPGVDRVMKLPQDDPGVQRMTDYLAYLFDMMIESAETIERQVTPPANRPHALDTAYEEPREEIGEILTRLRELPRITPRR